METLPYPSLDEIKSWSDSPDTLPPFWNIWATEKAWAQITAESQMFDHIEVQSKFLSRHQISVVVSDVFEYFYLQK